jgi:hypothetical protein
MWLRNFNAPKLATHLRRSRSQLGFQVAPLVEQLSTRLWNLSGKSPSRNLGGIEMVAAALRLVCNADEECSDSCERVGLRPKASKLRMMTVSAGSAR